MQLSGLEAIRKRLNLTESQINKGNKTPVLKDILESQQRVFARKLLCYMIASQNIDARVEDDEGKGQTKRPKPSVKVTFVQKSELDKLTTELTELFSINPSKKAGVCRFYVHLKCSKKVKEFAVQLLDTKNASPHNSVNNRTVIKGSTLEAGGASKDCVIK